ncbi:MAG: hypothetical protein ABS46_08800 [Cytophagaceae bacterium SCN 52-12]|nr:MAG: hypothetical protein ABS46_08800 [Cytophagaceae bacterium SCN 52-12]
MLMAQFRKLFAEKEQRQGFQWKLLLRTALTLIFLFVLWRILRREDQNLADVRSAVLHHLREGEGIWLFLLLILVPVNWALEALKWQLLVAKVQAISFSEAVGSTLAGLLSGLALPAQVGDVVGRIAALRVTERTKTVGAALVSGGIQFYAAIFAGIWGICRLGEKLKVTGFSEGIFKAGLWLLVLAGLLAFVFRTSLVSKIPPRGLWKRIRSMLEVISRYGNKELLTAFGIGFFRYLTYMAQFVAGLLLFDFPMGIYDMVACVSVVLLVKTVMPAFNLLGDLGLRGISAVFVFGWFGIPPDQVLAVTLLIWFTNILLPALTGLVWIWKRI